jgi:glutamate-1-semialdehyde 2,1-aminomutase
VPVTVQRVGTMLTPFFTGQPVRDYAEARRTDRAAYNAFFHSLLEGGVYLPPSAFEAAFTSTVHGESELEVLASALAATWRR